LSYGARGVAGRHRTCAPRVSGGRSTVLSYGHASGRGWIRTSDLLFVRQALNRSELLARAEKVGGAGVEPAASSVSEKCSPLSYPPKLRDKDSNPATPRVTSERGVLPLDDPGMSLTYVSPDSCRTMLSMPLAYPSTLDRRSRRARRRQRRPTWRSFGARILAIGGKLAGESRRVFASAISCASAEESFSLRRGLDSI
jgi:hypothetical protein